MHIISKLYALKRYYETVFDYIKYNQKQKSNKRFDVPISDRNFQLFDKTKNTTFDRHYIYFPAWAFRVLKKINPKKHIDISSTLHFCSTISTYIKTEFYDYRPANLYMSNLKSKHADITALPFKDNSVSSISCMHVLEHIGLGRYGDPIDPDGDIKGANELMRVTKKGGNLLMVLPVGKQRIQFNAHRIYSYQGIMKLFKGLKLKETYLIPLSPDSKPIKNAPPKLFNAETYGCGCFWFVKE